MPSMPGVLRGPPVKICAFWLPGRDGKPGAAADKPAHPQDRPSLRGSRLTLADQMWHAVTVAQRAVVRI